MFILSPWQERDGKKNAVKHISNSAAKATLLHSAIVESHALQTKHEPFLFAASFAQLAKSEYCLLCNLINILEPGKC